MLDCNKLAWSESYKIGDTQIDTEHQKIFELANRFSTYKDNPQKVKALIEEILTYTKFHFKNEEEYMGSIDYPNLKEHKILHAKLIKDLHDFLLELDSLQSDEIAKKLTYFINTRIVSHILLEDKKLLHYTMDRAKLKESFKWRNIYNIGDLTIDTEHKRLFYLANKALNYSYYQNMQKNLIQTVKELYEYIKKHFEHEEQYMQKIGYIKYEEHKILHDKIVESMNRFIKEVPKMQPQVLEKKLIEYIDIRFVNHIIVEDLKIACFAKKKKYTT